MRIQSARYLPTKYPTIDIEVADPSHSYKLANGVICHNTVSLLAGVSPGVHYPISRYYIRRIRIDNKSPLLPALIEAGFKIEPAVGSEKSTVVIEFPINLEKEIGTTNIITESEVSIWEKVKILIELQRQWSDNQVSATITFNPSESSQIKRILDTYDNELKSISFLPSSEKEYPSYSVYSQFPDATMTAEQYSAWIMDQKSTTPYPQMPYESITYEKWEELAKNIDLSKLLFVNIQNEQEIEIDTHCDGDKCTRITK